MATFFMIFQFFPLVLKAITAVEEIRANGANKKKIILDSVTSALQEISGTLPDNKTLNIISVLTDSTVKALNTAGVFTKTPIPAPAVYPGPVTNN